MKKYPFKFLDSYQREDRAMFFGRDEEIDALYEMLFQSSTVLVYGASGTGKTSLINCGLAGKFQRHDWLDLMIRRGSNINNSLTNALEQAGGKINPVGADSEWVDEWDLDGMAGKQELSPTARSIQAVYQKSFRPIYLIFDQFEELFILGSKPEQATFIETIRGVLQSNLPVKLIFSIREEYLGYLVDFEKAIPQLLRKKLRVEPMNLEKVKQVIIGASSITDSFISIKKGEEDAVAESIFNKIKGDKKSLTIQLPFLQVFLDKLYVKITGDKKRESPAEFSLNQVDDMGEIGDILTNFLEEQVADISIELQPSYPSLNPDLTWKILSPFATLEGTKDPITINELLERVPDMERQMVLNVVEAFYQSRLLRYNEQTETYEISHDSLAKPIAEKRSVEETSLLEIKRLIKSQVTVMEEARAYFTEKQLIYIENYLSKFKQSEEEKEWIAKSREFLKQEKQREAKQKYDDFVKSKKNRYLKIVIGVFVVIVALFIYLAINAKQNALLAQQEKAEAQAAQEYANELLELVMRGRGASYENLSNEQLADTIYKERTYPLEKLIQVNASVSPSNVGGNNRNYTMWLDMPSFRKDEIKEVQYHFCKGFIDRVRISKDPTSSFSIGYLGFGYCPTMKIDIIPVSGDTITQYFSFEKYFLNNPILE